MNDSNAPQPGGRQGDGRQTGHLVGRQSEMDRIRAFLATARTDGGALLVTGEPGVGKTVLLNAASEAASAEG
ncbi:MAG: AAA family ATPase, partial [Chloroflexota bacterium]